MVELEFDNRFQEGGIAIIDGHPDDTGGLFHGLVTQARASGIEVAIIDITSGQRGGIEYIPGASKKDINRRLKANGKLREQEELSYASAIGATAHFVRAQDMRLGLEELETPIKRTLEELRQIDPAAIFSFGRNIVTPEFDHPDHILAALIALYVSSAYNVPYFIDGIEPANYRPGYYALDHNLNVKKSRVEVVVLDEESRKLRKRLLRENFSTQDIPEEILDEITWDEEVQAYLEKYLRIRNIPDREKRVHVLNIKKG